MKKIYFTCGPSQLYPTVSKHLKKALAEDILSVSHRSKEFQKIFKSTQESLKKLMNIPENYHIFFLSSSLESMERVLENCVEKNSFHIVNGAFSQKWQEEAVAENKLTGQYNPEWSSAINLEKISINKEVELICITQNETSTGIALPMESIYKLRYKFPKKLIAVDIVSSAPYPRINFKHIDLAFFSVQKGFGLPAGLGILIVNERAVKKSQVLMSKKKIGTAFHSFSSLLEKEKIFQTPETPNVLNIFLLGKVTRDMLNKGIEKIRQDTEIKAKLLYDFFDKHEKYKPQIKEAEFRSRTTINIDVGNDKNKIIKKLTAKGLVVSSGYGRFKETHIRIANFPSHSVSDIEKLIGLIGYN